MGGISAFVDVLAAIVKTAGVVANVGRPQLIKQLDVLRTNLEQFKEAVYEGDTVKMHQLLAACKAESAMLEKRLFRGLDRATSAPLGKTIEHARAMKTKMVRQPRPSPEKMKQALQAKAADFASAIDSVDGKKRQKLIVEIDEAIGTLSGISKSLESYLL